MLTLQIVDGQSHFNPGDDVQVQLGWSAESRPDSIVLSLTWHTEGKGDRDSSVVESITIDVPAQRDSLSLAIGLPDGPYSFSGQLISLIWAVEAVAQPSRESARQQIVVGPGKQEVALAKVDDK